MRSEDRRDLATATVGAGGVASGGLLRHAAVESMSRKPKIHLVGVLRNGTKAQRRVFAAGSLLGLGGTAPLAVGATRLATGRNVEKVAPRYGAGMGGLGASGALSRSQRSPLRSKFLGDMRAKRPQYTDEEKAAQRVRASVAGKKAAQASAEAQRERKYGQHRAQQAMHRYMNREFNLEKADTEPKRSFLGEGLRGAGEALHGRGKAALQPVPKEVRATQLGIAAGAGFGGSAVARAALHGRAGVLKPVVAPLAGALSATGSIPLTNRTIAGRGYKVTPYGVTRAKTAPQRPSSKATTVDSRKGPLRAQVVPSDQRFGKAEDYLGSRTSYPAQRAAVTLAGHPPVLGPFTSAATAGKFAPPGQERKAALRQYSLGSAAPVAVGVGGAYAGAHLAERSAGFEHRASQLVGLKDKAEGRVRSAIGLKPKVGPGRLVSRLADTKAARPLLRSRAAAVGAAGGFLGAKMASGAVLGQTAISMNQRDQTSYNRKHNIVKGQSKREKHQLAERKRLNATLSVAGGSAGLAGLGLYALKHKGPATTASIVSGGLGGTNALLGAKVQRQEARQVDPFAKRDEWQKQAPLKTSISEGDARKLVARHGLKGPLPKELNREQRRAAYEARYVSAGGHKAEKWQHRAVVADKVKTAGLAGATAGGAAWVGTRVKPLRMAGAALARHSPVLRRVSGSRIAHHAETAAGASAVVGGAGELYAAHARRKRSSYASAPGGVAASALRRMNDYTPGG